MLSFIPTLVSAEELQNRQGRNDAEDGGDAGCGASALRSNGSRDLRHMLVCTVLGYEEAEAG